MAVDYEVEYNNRARVPDHAAIFARWNSEAAAYRERMKAEENAELGLAYGEPARPWTCSFPTPPAMPLALFIHGGYWRALEPSTFSHMSAGLNARGIAVAVAGYELCPQVTILQIIEQIRTACLFLWRRFGQRLMVYGHSAGGHLAAAMVATDGASSIEGPGDLVPLAIRSRPVRLKPLVHPRRTRTSSSRRPRGVAAGGRFRAGACSMRWRAPRSRANSCARAAPSRTIGASAASRRITRRGRVQTISRWSIRLPIRRAP